MDERMEDQRPEEEAQGYTPRPAWQVNAARVALIFVILFVIYQILAIAMGGR